MHDPRQPRRTGHTPNVWVPLKPKMDPMHRHLLLVGSVTFSALIIFGLYAASFRYQRALSDDTRDLPRWAVLKSNVIDSLKPIEQQAEAIANVKTSMGTVVNAQITQAEATAILKQKLESATTTHTN